ncbi:protein FAM98A [Arctopsyche grandis]|uniref:protein FAM98A n=1 Tax=Arctopsyche grandis TaxID=121162 RepID=UPI00406D7B15
MENDILDALNDIGYSGLFLKPDAFPKMIEGGPKSVEYTGLIHKMSEELKSLCSLEESVNATEGPDDASSFLLELSSFLKELGCTYNCFTTGPMSARLQSNEDRLLLLDYLISELMAARMLSINNPQSKDSMEVTIQESPTAKDLKDILMSLKINKPPANVTIDAIFSKVEAKLKEAIQKEGPNYVGRPIYNKAVTDRQWKEIEANYKRLCEDYKMRRDMLITRLDCTIESFEWSGEGGKKRDEIQNVYRPLRANLKSTSALKLSDFLAARSSLLILRKTSDAAVRVNTQSQVNKVIIGKVPDRGGRPSEQQAPPPEMPSWQQRSQGGGGGGGGGRGGGSGFGGGSRVQGNWNQGQQKDNNRGGGGGRGQGDRNQQGFQENRGYQDTKGNNQGYQDNRNQGGYQENRNQGYKDNRGGGGYQNYQQPSQGTQGYQNYQQQGQYQNYQSQGYQQQSAPNYQAQTYQDQGYQGQGGFRGHNQGYQNQNQGKGQYQNEHDDRTNNFSRGGGRGRSNYNRGGRR